MKETIPAVHLNESHIGYVVNTEYSKSGQRQIAKLQRLLLDRFGEAIWVPKPDWLHITLMDWLAPLVDYGKDKDKIFPEIQEYYSHSLDDAINNIRPIDVDFKQIYVNPDAIFILGKDKGQYQRIRDNFISNVRLLPNTKLPPKIIHSTVARFRKKIDLDEVKDYINTQEVSFTETINNFRLLRTTDSRMENIKLLHRYYLK